jgi:MoaD family protein
MARVNVKMFATVRESAGVSECSVDASDIDDLLSVLSGLLGQEFSEVVARARKDPDGLVVLLNGRNVRPGSESEVRLADGDEVSIFPPVSGG